MPPLFIHIGTHKTGSTAIQRAFRTGEKNIAKSGLTRLKSCDTIPLPALSPEEVQRLTLAVQQEAAKAGGESRRFFMTSEGFSGDPMTGYADAPVFASRLRTLTQGFDAKIIVFLRRQDDFIESWYTQRIHEGRSETFAEFLQKIRTEEMSWLRLVEAYAHEFGRENIIVRRYHKAFYPEPADLLVDFCKIVNVDPRLIAQSLGRVRNQGFSREAVELARACNPHLDRDQQKHLRQLLQVISAKPIFHSYCYYEPEARQNLLAQHQASNDEVARQFVNEGAEATLFPAEEPLAAPLSSSGSETDCSLQITLVRMLLEMKAAEKRSGLLRFVMRTERRLHDLRHSSPSRRPPTKATAPATPNGPGILPLLHAGLGASGADFLQTASELL